jgi:hypothetical protein
MNSPQFLKLLVEGAKVNKTPEVQEMLQNSLNKPASAPIIKTEPTVDPPAKKKTTIRRYNVKPPVQLVKSSAPSTEELQAQREIELQAEIALKIKFEQEHRLDLHCGKEDCTVEHNRFLDTDAFTVAQCSSNCIIRYHDQCFKTLLGLKYNLSTSQLKKATYGSLKCPTADCNGTLHRITHMLNHEMLHRHIWEVSSVAAVTESDNSSFEMQESMDDNTSNDSSSYSSSQCLQNSSSEECKEDKLNKEPIVLRDMSTLKQIKREIDVNNLNVKSKIEHGPVTSNRKNKKKALHITEFCSIPSSALMPEIVPEPVLSSELSKDQIKQSKEGGLEKPISNEIIAREGVIVSATPKLKAIKNPLPEIDALYTTWKPQAHIVLPGDLEGVNEKKVISKIKHMTNFVKMTNMEEEDGQNIATVFQFKDAASATLAVNQLSEIPLCYVRLSKCSKEFQKFWAR